MVVTWGRVLRRAVWIQVRTRREGSWEHGRTESRVMVFPRAAGRMKRTEPVVVVVDAFI